MLMKIMGALLSMLMLFTAGCATPALWGRKDYFPKDVTLMVSPQAGDILVRYNEDISTNSFHRSPVTHEFQPRAYWLMAHTNAAKGFPPEFVDVTISNDWTSIPFVTVVKKLKTSTVSCPCKQSTNESINHSFLSTTLVTNALPEHGYYAIAKGSKFEVWRDGEKTGTFKFPASHSEWESATFWRVTLTPGAVIADTVVVVVVGAVIVAVLYVSHGGTIPTFH
jgi:hypothetical protein